MTKSRPGRTRPGRVSCIAVLTLVTAVQAELIVGQGSYGAGYPVYDVNPGTGAATRLYTDTVWGLVVDRAAEKVYTSIEFDLSVWKPGDWVPPFSGRSCSGPPRCVPKP